MTGNAKRPKAAWFDKLTMSAHPEPVEGCELRGLYVLLLCAELLRQLPEEIVGGLLGGGVDEARAHGGNQPAHLDVRVAGDASRVAVGGQCDRGGSADEARTALPFEAERQRIGRLLVANRRFSAVRPLETGDTDLQRGLVTVRTVRGERLTAGNAAPQDARVDERREHTGAVRRHDARKRDLHM